MLKAISCCDDKRYQAEDDARTLKRYAEISGDKSRISAAGKILKDEAAATSKALGMTRAPDKSKKASPPNKNSVNNIKSAMMSNMSTKSKGKK